MTDPNDQTGPFVGIVAAPRETWSQSIDRAPILTPARAAELLADDREAEASEPTHRDPNDAATWHLPARPVTHEEARQRVEGRVAHPGDSKATLLRYIDEREAADAESQRATATMAAHVQREIARAIARAEKAESTIAEWGPDSAQAALRRLRDAIGTEGTNSHDEVVTEAIRIAAHCARATERAWAAEAALANATAQIEAAEAACTANADAMLAATARAEKAETALAAAETSSLAARGWPWERRRAVYLATGAAYAGSARDRAINITDAERRTAVSGDSAAVTDAMVAELERLERTAGETPATDGADGNRHADNGSAAAYIPSNCTCGRKFRKRRHLKQHIRETWKDGDHGLAMPETDCADGNPCTNPDREEGMP